MLHSRRALTITTQAEVQRKRAFQNRKKLLFYTSNSAFKIKINNRRQGTFFFSLISIFRSQPLLRPNDTAETGRGGAVAQQYNHIYTRKRPKIHYI